MSPSPRREELRSAMECHVEALAGYLGRRVSGPEDAADLLSEVLLQAWRRVDSFPDDSAERQRMWFFTIARNTLLNHHRARSRRRALESKLIRTAERDAADVQEDELVAVRDAVRRLEASHRELIELVHWEGWSIGEAATLMRLNPSTARSRYAAARSELRHALQEQVPGHVAAE